MKPYRRSIYIGLGGLGVQVVSKVKEFFNEKVNGDKTLPMIKYLGIDTDHYELLESNLNDEEQVFLFTYRLITLFQAHLQNFPWMPDENKDYLNFLSHSGSGQIRSNGRYAFEVNRRIICERLQRYYHELVDIRLEMADIINSPNIDIHVVSSIVGGTGSGIVIEFAKIIKEAIPNSNVMGYFFSDSFFRSIGIGWNIKANAYATLFELNSEMSSSNKPFDTFLFIDNKTDSRNGKLKQYTIDLESAINSTVSTMCMIPSFGNGHWSFFDDVKAAMASGFYNQGQRMAWITSIGSSAISYHKDKINYNDLLVNIENVERDIYNMLRRSEVLLNVDYNGETVMHDVSFVISTPPGLEQFIRNIVGNHLNNNSFVVVQGEENEIRAYKTAFLFTPRSISGLNVNESFANSNEASVIETLKQGRYSPFTDKNYQNLYNATKGL